MSRARSTVVTLLTAALAVGMIGQSHVDAAVSKGPKTCPAGKTRVLIKQRAACLTLNPIRPPAATTPLSLLGGYTAARKAARGLEKAFVPRPSNRPTMFAKQSFGRKADKRTQAFIKKRANDFLSVPSGVFLPPKPKKNRFAQTAGAFPVGYTQALAGGGVVTVLPGDRMSLTDSAESGDTTVTTTAVNEYPGQESGPDETGGWNGGMQEMTTETVVKNKSGEFRQRLTYGAKAKAPKCPTVTGGVSGKGDAVTKILMNVRKPHGSLHGFNVVAKAVFAYSAQLGDDGRPVSRDIQVEAKFDATSAAADGGTNLKLRQSLTIHVAANGTPTVSGGSARIDDVRIPDTTDYYTGEGAKNVNNLTKAAMDSWKLLTMVINQAVEEQLRRVHKHWNTAEDCAQTVFDPAQVTGVHIGDSGNFSAAVRTALGVPVPNVKFSTHFVQGDVSENGLTTGSGGEPTNFDWTSTDCPADGGESVGVTLESTSLAGKTRKRWIATCEDREAVPLFTVHATVKTTYHLPAGDFVVDDYTVDGQVSERSAPNPPYADTSTGVGVVDGSWMIIDLDSGHETESATLTGGYSAGGADLIFGWVPDGDFGWRWSGIQVVAAENGTTVHNHDGGDGSETVTTVTISDLRPSP